MDEIDKYIEETTQKCLTSQPDLDPEKVKEHFYNIILLTTIDNLTDEQFVEIKDLEPQDPALGQKLEEFSSQMPFLAQAIQDKIDADAQYIQKNGQIPQEVQQ